MTWGGLNPALTSWRNGINERLPGRDTTTDGARADKLHGSTSQHQEDPDGTVDAFDNDVNYLRSNTPTGSAAELAIAEALKLDFEADANNRGQLWIHDRQIANADIDDWRERYYDGESPHDHHVHWQSRQSRERDGSPWAFTHLDALLRRMNGDDMDPKDLLDYDSVPNLYGDAKTNPTITVRNALKAAVSADLRASRIESRLTAMESNMRTLLERIPAPPAA